MSPVLRLSACAATVTLALAGCSSSSGSDGTPASMPATVHTSTESVPSIPAPATSDPNLPTDAAGRVAQWYAGVAGLFAAIQVDTEHIQADATQQDVQSLQGHCASLRTDAAKVQGSPTAPDKRIAAAVATAMTAYVAAAQSCLHGDYPATATQINKGGAALESANAIMNNLS